MEESRPISCCDNLFVDFQFQDLCNATPPEKKGVYVVRIKEEGTKVDEVVSSASELLRKLHWGIVEEYVVNRVTRLRRIGSCRTIYIGSAGTTKTSKNTLAHRYSEFTHRHTAMFPLWCLVYFGWELEYGWKVGEDAGRLERELKSQYMKCHNGNLPTLVER